MNKETQVKIQLLSENDLTEAMRLIEPANWNQTKKTFAFRKFSCLLGKGISDQKHYRQQGMV